MVTVIKGNQDSSKPVPMLVEKKKKKKKKRQLLLETKRDHAEGARTLLNDNNKTIDRK